MKAQINMKEMDEKTEKLIQAILQVRKIPRNLRNRNPGNIVYDKRNKWVGQTGQDGRFVRFKSMRHGYRALFILLYNYHKAGLTTIQLMLNRFAPSTENNTATYIAQVARLTCLPGNAPLLRPFDTGAAGSWQKIALAITSVESGIPKDKLQPLVQDDIVDGYIAAMNRKV